VKATIRGLATVGSAGVGFILVAPYELMNDGTAVAATTATYPNVVTPSQGAAYVAGQVNVSAAAQQPYSNGSFGSRLARTVACGIRVRYVGTELNRGGRLLYAQNPQTGTQTFSNQNINDLGNRQDSVIVPVTRKWTTVSYIPGTADAYSYDVSPNDGIVRGGVYALQGAGICIMMEGTPGNNFEFEAVWYSEWIPGRGADDAVPSVTASHSDLTGMSAVRDYISGTVQTAFGPDVYAKFLRWAETYAVGQISHFVGGPALGSVPLLEYL